VTGRIAAIRRYPVKSVAGEELPAAVVERRGLVGDRLWALADAEGRLGSGKTTRRFVHVEGLLGLAARLPGPGTPLVRLPDGRELAVGDPALDSAASEVLGQPLRLVREASIPHHDAAPVHLVTTAGLAALGRQAGGPPVEPGRLRPNLVIEWPGADADGEPEEGWLGHDVHVGEELVLRVQERTERCRMVDLPHRDAPARPGLLRALAAATDACAGVYAAVLVPGRVRVGDGVHVVRR